MTIQDRPLKDIYADVRNEVENKLRTATDLNHIQSVIYGEKTSIGRLQSPAIWIVPSSYTPQLQGGHTAQHDITFDIVNFVKSNNAQEGLKQAQDNTMLIYDVLVRDRQLGGLVSDVRPNRIDPAYEAGQSTHLYWSACQFVFRLKRRE